MGIVKGIISGRNREEREERIAKAQAIIDERNRWCEYTLSTSLKAKFLNWVAHLPLIWRLGTPITLLYAKHHPDIDMKEVLGILMAAPITSSMYSPSIVSKMFIVEPVGESE